MPLLRSSRTTTTVCSSLSVLARSTHQNRLSSTPSSSRANSTGGTVYKSSCEPICEWHSQLLIVPCPEDIFSSNSEVRYPLVIVLPHFIRYIGRPLAEAEVCSFSVVYIQESTAKLLPI